MKRTTYKIILLILALSFSYSSHVHAQTDRELKLAVFPLIKTHFEADFYKTKNFKNRVLVFSVTVGVNASGIVDTVIYTNRDSKMDSIFWYDYGLKAVKKNKEIFQDYKNCLLVFPVIFRRLEDDVIQTRFTDFYIDFEQLLPSDLHLKFPKRKIRLCSSFTTGSVKPEH